MAKKKNQVVLLLTDRTLSVQSIKGKPNLLVFPAALVEDKKIIDKPAFTAFLTQELEDALTKVDDCIIVLGRGVLYQIAQPKDEGLDEKELKAFFASLPFKQADALKKTIQTENKEYLLVTNKSYLNALLNACEKNDTPVSAVVPLSLFSDDEEQEELSSELVKKIMESEAVFPSGDFLAEIPTTLPSAPVANQSDEAVVQDTAPQLYTRETSLRVSRIMLIMAILVFGLLAIGAGILSLERQSPPAPAMTAEPTATPTATPVPTVAKDLLKVSVLNGTGTAGQAGKVKTILEGLSFKDITTGNADTNDATDTTVSFSDRVSAEIQKEVVQTLEKTFTKVETQKASSSSADITVTTGTEK
jgi:hypothetical protein